MGLGGGLLAAPFEISTPFPPDFLSFNNQPGRFDVPLAVDADTY
jgi:hypothetical protein